MSFTPNIIDAELKRLRAEVHKHVGVCKFCRNSLTTDDHARQLMAEIRGVWFRHRRRCHTCRTRGESAILDHQKVIMQLFVFMGASL